jgi:predicted nucleic acid-binding protein
VICVDASVAVKWLWSEELSDVAHALFQTSRAANEPIVAPPLLPIEITNVIYRRTRAADGPTRDEAAKLLARFLAFPIVLHNPTGLHERALTFAHVHGLPAAYDAHDLALADMLGCALWTDDQRLVRTLAGRLPLLRPLAKFSSG